MARMDATERDGPEDWLLPESRMPPTIEQLRSGIDEALATARAAESAAVTVGAAALDAAEQAREAAEQAHRSAEPAGLATSAMVEGRRREDVVAEDRSMRSFSERADRVVARLRRLELGSLSRVG
jgi:hypothetical protein